MKSSSISRHTFLFAAASVFAVVTVLTAAAGASAFAGEPDDTPSAPAPVDGAGEAPGPSAASDSAKASDPNRINDPEFLARARAYTRGNWILYFSDMALTLGILGIVSFSGLSARVWSSIRSRAGEGARGTILYVGAFIVFLSIVSLPLDWYDGFLREHDYGFSTQTAGSWFTDRIKGLAITIAIATAFVIPLFAVIRRFPRSWWIFGAALGCFFALILVVVAPVFIDPLFNEFTPLKDQELRETILGMAHRNGIPAEEVFEMDASSRSVHDNAYVTGLLGTQRVVLYDTLLAGYTRDEIAFVMGHEMGHYVLNHIWKGLALAFLAIVAGFFVVNRSLGWACGAGATRTGFTKPGDLATLPFMLMVLTAFIFVTSPIQSGWSRHLESEADQFGLRAVAAPEAGSLAFRKMAARNLSDPDPPAIIEWFLYSHPAIAKRIRAAEEYVASLPDPATAPE